MIDEVFGQVSTGTLVLAEILTVQPDALAEEGDESLESRRPVDGWGRRWR